MRKITIKDTSIKSQPQEELTFETLNEYVDAGVEQDKVAMAGWLGVSVEDIKAEVDYEKQEYVLFADLSNRKMKRAIQKHKVSISPEALDGSKNFRKAIPTFRCGGAKFE